MQDKASEMIGRRSEQRFVREFVRSGLFLNEVVRLLGSHVVHEEI